MTEIVLESVFEIVLGASWTIGKFGLPGARLATAAPDRRRRKISEWGCRGHRTSPIDPRAQTNVCAMISGQARSPAF